VEAKPYGSDSGAEFADGGGRRLALWRRWAPGPRALWVCLNPSTAGEAREDSTTRKIRGFSERLGCGSYVLVNLFDYCATDPRALYDDRLVLCSAGNLDRIVREGRSAALIVCAWGKHGWLRGQATALLARLRAEGLGQKLRALRINADGSPSHPLMLEYSSRTVPYGLKENG
jgi:hypothetical protein